MAAPSITDKERNGFTFFRSFRDAVSMTDPDEQLTLYKAITDYALDQIEPDISTLGTLGRLCWTAIRPNIESGVIKFRNGCKGGAPKGNRNASKTTENQPRINPKTTYPLLNENENVDENAKRRNVCMKKSIAFVAPSFSEVKEYVNANGYTSVDPQQFIDHYTAVGWMVGKNPMKEWRAAVRNWNRRAFNNPKTTTASDENKPRYQAL